MTIYECVQFEIYMHEVYCVDELTNVVEYKNTHTHTYTYNIYTPTHIYIFHIII